MRQKGLVVLAAVLVLLSLTSCKSKPEQGLLERYFHAVSLNDITTMSTMAVDPLKIEAASWKIVKVSEEQVTPAALPDLNKIEMDFKKQVDAKTPVVLDAQDALYVAKDEQTAARTGGARAAAKTKVDAAQLKYDEEYKNFQELKTKWNEAKAAATKEEEISTFSLGAGQLANIRDLTGTVHSKELEVEIKEKDGSTKTYKIITKKYDLRDEAAGIDHRGRWVITKFEQL